MLLKNNFHLIYFITVIPHLGQQNYSGVYCTDDVIPCDSFIYISLMGAEICFFFSNLVELYVKKSLLVLWADVNVLFWQNAQLVDYMLLHWVKPSLQNKPLEFTAL